MTVKNTNAFIDDVVSEIKNRCEEAQSDMKSSPDDSFSSGRALAYQEMFEIIKSRLKIYGINNVDMDNQ